MKKRYKISENVFLKFIVACFRTGNDELANDIVKKQKKESA